MPKWIADHLAANGESLSSHVFLALTRGLYRAPVLPGRDPSLFGSFQWHTYCDDIPLGCKVFTDGSFLDGKLQSGCQSLGWAFVVVNSVGDLVAAAFGVPPRWIDTIQGAELLAVQSALACVLFPEKLYTDCKTVQMGVKRSQGWMCSSKRRFARVWAVVWSQLEGDADFVQWMPAHMPESSIGSATCSDGVLMSEEMWCANQIVDQLAKDAAESARLPSASRSWLASREEQLKELAIFMGRLTFAANSHLLPDGTKIRDSQAVKSFRRVAKHSGAFQGKRREGTGSSKATSCQHGFVRANGSWCKPRYHRSSPSVQNCKPSLHGVSVFHGASAARRALKGLQLRQEAAFQDWWRESRSQSMKPKGADAPTGKERLQALKARVAARQAASQ